MKVSIIAILVSISAIAYGQDTIPAELNRKVSNTDTISVSMWSKEALKELTGQLAEVQKTAQLLGIVKVELFNEELQKRNNDIVERIMLIVSSYIDPKQLDGFTEDYQIIKKK